MKTEERKKGDAGEGVALRYLKKCGYRILERNYKNRIGELDIIAKKDNVVIFVEVKSQDIRDIRYGPAGERLYPERSVDWRKQRKLIKTAEYYLLEKDCDEDTNWQIDVIGVDLDELARRANLRHLKNAVERRW